MYKWGDVRVRVSVSVGKMLLEEKYIPKHVL